eukprot:1926265-Rhodomonas_salina.1
MITGSIPEPRWTQSFNKLGIGEHQHPKMLHKTVVTVAAIQALTEFLGVTQRRSLAPYTFPLDVPTNFAPSLPGVRVCQSVRAPG